MQTPPRHKLHLTRATYEIIYKLFMLELLVINNNDKENCRKVLGEKLKDRIMIDNVGTISVIIKGNILLLGSIERRAVYPFPNAKVYYLLP